MALMCHSRTAGLTEAEQVSHAGLNSGKRKNRAAGLMWTNRTEMGLNPAAWP